MPIRYQKIKTIYGLLILGIATLLSAQTPPHEQLLQAESHFYQGCYSLAQVELEDYLQSASPADENVRPFFFLAECFYLQGKYEKAIPLFQEILRTTTALPFRPRMALDLGRSCYFTRDLPTAENTLTDIILDFKDTPIIPQPCIGWQPWNWNRPNIVKPSPICTR